VKLQLDECVTRFVKRDVPAHDNAGLNPTPLESPGSHGLTPKQRSEFFLMTV